MKHNLSDIPKQSDKHLLGDECFTLNGEDTQLTILDFWRWHFSEIYDLQSKMAEYIVAKALGLKEAQNAGDWTLYDILYRGKRIEIKESAYFHAWQTDEEPKSRQRTFGITKAYDKYQDSTSELRRQNDIYVFCLNTGETKAESYPLELKNWEFYIVPTSVINDVCKDGKSISLSRVRKLSPKVEYTNIKTVIDGIIDTED